MNTLTQYRRPQPRYGKRQAAESPWHTCGGWRQWDCGSWGRVYTVAGRRRWTVARRAAIYRTDGWWQWRVEEFDLGTRQVRRICARNLAGVGYLTPAAAFPYADLAARTAD